MMLVTYPSGLGTVEELTYQEQEAKLDAGVIPEFCDECDGPFDQGENWNGGIQLDKQYVCNSCERRIRSLTGMVL